MAMVGLSLKEISYSQTMDVQNDKLTNKLNKLKQTFQNLWLSKV
jgi:hypothetical protein